MKVLKKNQLAILVIALMLITAGYLNYTANGESIQINSNTAIDKQIAAIGDATLVNSGELLEEKDKQNIINTINNANIENTLDTNNNEDISNAISENTINSTIETNAATNDNYFASSKLERDKMYSQMLETYQKLLESDTISSEQKAISQQEINNINQTKNAIMITENLITTKGFKNLVIFVNDTSVNAIIEAEDLSTEQIAQIQNIISRELKAEIENIHISNK